MQSKIKKQVLTTGKSNQNELAQKLESMQNEPSSKENANNKNVSIPS